MARRKDRVPVVFDTNVIVGALLGTKRQSANQRVYRLWLHRQLQLIVSPEIAAEYLELIERLRISPPRAAAFRERLQRHDIITHVHLGPRFTASRARMTTLCWRRRQLAKRNISSRTITICWTSRQLRNAGSSSRS